MDDAYVRAVMRAFVHLYEKKWIYRANRIINWCPFHQTSLSDLELVHVERRRRADDDPLSVRWTGDGGIAIATARPATIPADVAVAVHPDDERYKDAIGREVIVPFVERPVLVIADERVDPDFGTGALKVTPGHDPLDFAIGRDHELPEPMAIGPDGRMNDHVPELAGLTQEEAEEKILAWCKERDLAREARVVPAHRRAVRAVREPHRAADLAPVVVRHGRPEAARAGGAARAARALPPGVAAPLRDRVARERAGLVHLPPALVGPPAADLGVQERPPDGRGDRPGRLRGVRRDGARPLRGRARHVVLVGALAVRDARLAGGDARPRRVLSRAPPDDRARDHPPLGEPHDLHGARADRRDPLRGRDHPLDRARARRAAHVEEPRHRHRPARRDRRPRRGRGALRAAEDVLHPGRALLVRRGRGGAQAREQALERGAAHPGERRGRRAGAAPARRGGALDPGARSTRRLAR